MRTALRATGTGLFLVFLAISAPEYSAHSEEEIPTIQSTGGAVLVIPFDSLRLVLELKTRSNSFEKVKAIADEKFNLFRTRVEEKGYPRHTFHYGFSMLDQAGLSMGERGSEIVHTLGVVVSGISQDALHGEAVDLIDHALSLSKRLKVVDLTAFYDDKILEDLRAELLATAARRARERASIVATSAGARLGDLRSLRFPGTALPEQRQVHDAGAEASAITAFAMEDLDRIRVRKREQFELRQPFVAATELSVQVTAVFELLPQN